MRALFYAMIWAAMLTVIAPDLVAGRELRDDRPFAELSVEDRGLGGVTLAPGEPLTAARLEPLLREAMIRAEPELGVDLALGARLDLSLDRRGLPLPNTATTPMAIVVEALRYDRRRARFDAELSASLPEGARAELRFSGRARLLADVAAPIRDIRPGEIVDADDFALIELDARRRPAGAGVAIERLEGRMTARRLPKGRPVTTADFAAPPVVREGDLVEMVYDGEALFLKALARVEADAGLGEVVAVVNLDSGRKVEARVEGAGLVRALGSGSAGGGGT